jgi:NAD(P)-dependent dehydrogenase (short-subunit alcohol dehydrogenase family)
MAPEFAGKIVIVAGGTGALGSAISRAFSRDGATVIAVYRTAAEFQSLSAAPEAKAKKIEGEQADVTSESEVRRLVEAVVKRHSRVDALINAVGGYVGGGKLWESNEAVLDRMLATNLRPFYVLARAIVPILVKQGHGSIVNVVARAAIEPLAGASAYAASKAGALAMAESLAAELVGTGVRVNSILPRIIDTPANRQAMPKADFAKWPKPEPIAELIVYLCSDAAEAVHGTAIPV